MAPKQKPKKSAIPRAPSTLGKPGKAYWKTVYEQFMVEDHHTDLLLSACMQLDRAGAAREVIAKEGVVKPDRFGQDKIHPAIELERNAHLTFCKLQRELGLDILPPQQNRGPRRTGTGA